MFVNCIATNMITFMSRGLPSCSGGGAVGSVAGFLSFFVTGSPGDFGASVFAILEGGIILVVGAFGFAVGA